MKRAALYLKTDLCFEPRPISAGPCASTFIVSGAVAMHAFLVTALAALAPTVRHEVPTINSAHGGAHNMFAKYNNHPFAAGGGRRQLSGAADQYRPLRIVTYIVEESNKGVSQANLDYLRTSILPAAVRYWSNALSVVPVAGNLKAARFCTSTYPAPDNLCASVDSTRTCGDINIPQSHFNDTQTYAWDQPAQVFRSTAVPGGPGVPGADFVLYVTANNNSLCVTSGGESTGTLAYALSCLRDQHDRPTFGMSNFCPGMIKREASAWEDQVATAIHEIGHALGMNAANFPLMRDASAGGAPRTARGADGQPAEVYADCPDGIKRWRSNVSASTVQIAPLTPGATGAPLTASHHVARLVTPRVQAEARAHFGCASLAGAELENWVGINGNICSGPDKSCGQLATSGACAGQSGCSWILSACLGSHWDERLFKNNMMSPNSNLATFTPRVLLAFLEDTG